MQRYFVRTNILPFYSSMNFMRVTTKNGLKANISIFKDPIQNQCLLFGLKQFSEVKDKPLKQKMANKLTGIGEQIITMG